MEANYSKEQQYIKAKKRVEEIRGFYSHLVITVLMIPFLIFINLEFSPHYHWFWWAIFGMTFGLLFHWFGVFGYKVLGLGKDWEEKKIKEIMNDRNF